MYKPEEALPEHTAQSEAGTSQACDGYDSPLSKCQEELTRCILLLHSILFSFHWCLTDVQSHRQSVMLQSKSARKDCILLKPLQKQTPDASFTLCCSHRLLSYRCSFTAVAMVTCTCQLLLRSASGRSDWTAAAAPTGQAEARLALIGCCSPDSD